jgi:hypothetical protein
LFRSLLPVAILAATFLAYAGTLFLGFVFDDHVLILTNDSIRSWRSVPGFFASHIWAFRYPHLLANYYRPLFLVWLRLNNALFGLRPWGWHLASVLAHLAVTYLVYRLCLRLLPDRGTAAAAALLFGIHPVHVESVAYLSAAQEPLCTFFMLAALLWMRPGAPSRAFVRAVTSCVLFAAALLCKESAMVLPLLVIGFAWIYGVSGSREAAPIASGTRFALRLWFALAASIPYWVVILIYVPVRVWALKGFAHIVTRLTWSQEIFTIPSVLLFYLRLLVWPLGLSCYYDNSCVARPGWHEFAMPVAVLAIVAAGLAYWYTRVRRSQPPEARAVAFAGLWLLMTLLPVLNFRLLPEGEIAHDRYLYLPSVGFVMLAAIALRQAIRAMAGSSRLAAWALPGAALLLFGVMGCATARQTLFWADDLTLNIRAHQIAPHNVSATTSLAAAVAQRGMDGAAMALYQQALALQPGFWRANVNLAYLYYAHGNFPEATRYFARACAADPTDGDQFLFLAMALLRTGHLPEAEQAARTALVVRPNGAGYHLGLAMVLKQEGRLLEAREQAAAELAQNPNDVQARNFLDSLTRAAQRDEKADTGHRP